MSHSERDTDIRKLRQLSKAKSSLIPQPCATTEAEAIMRSAEYVAIQTEFDQLFAKYGSNPNIFKDNERAGSKRGVAKKIRDAVRRSDKRSAKNRLHNEFSSPIGEASDP